MGCLSRGQLSRCLADLQGLQNADGSIKTECGIHVADDVKGKPRRAALAPPSYSRCTARADNSTFDSPLMQHWLPL